MRSHGLEPTRLLCPWDFPGKNIGVGCHFLLQEIFSTQRLNSRPLLGRFFTTEPPDKPTEKLSGEYQRVPESRQLSAFCDSCFITFLPASLPSFHPLIHLLSHPSIFPASPISLFLIAYFWNNFRFTEKLQRQYRVPIYSIPSLPYC